MMISGWVSIWRRRAQQAAIVLALLGTLGLSAAAGPAQTESPSLPTVAVAVELTGDARKARLSFILSRKVEAKAFLLERPDRVIVDLPEVNFHLPAGSGQKGSGLVASYRYGLFAQGRSRVVIDLAEPALVAKVSSEPQAGNLFVKLVIELAETDRAQYRRAALKPMVNGADLPDAPDASSDSAAEPGDTRTVIALDPGHGGVDYGAVSASGTVEKNVVFAFAQRLKDKLEHTGRYRVLMTRDTDTFISLPDRVKVARQAKAALFLSIHADILNASPTVRGATIYTGSEFATDDEAAQLAEKENRADAVAGVDSRDAPEEVAGILMDLTKRETKAFSGQFARKLVTDLKTVIKLNKNPHRSAGFRVLKAPDVPSVLIELGYLSSEADDGLLNSEDWRERSTVALARAIDRYFATRLSAGRSAAVSP